MPTPRPHFSLRFLALGACALGALGHGPSWSHGIQSNLETISPLGEQVRREFLLQSEFSSGEPADDAVVRLWRGDGETIEMGRTDAQGKLRFELPAELSEEWEVQVDAGPGHRDYLGLAELSDGPAPQDADGASAAPAGWSDGLSSRGLGRLLAQRPAGAPLPLVGGLAMGLAAASAMLLKRRRR